MEIQKHDYPKLDELIATSWDGDAKKAAQVLYQAISDYCLIYQSNGGDRDDVPINDAALLYYRFSESLGIVRDIADCIFDAEPIK
ncbi:MAG: hypothetical protein LKF31_10150 [Muribaculaceae bacterium]|jgi:hypothetical protein|nr:hypothetical protein [Muribaculaceae bacterium]